MDMSNQRKNIDLLNESLDGEYFGIAAYQAAIDSGLPSEDVKKVATKFQSDHRAHAGLYRKAIQEMEGTPCVSKSWGEYSAAFPPPPLNSQEDVLRYAATLEKSAAAGTLATVAKFTLPNLATLAASIVGVEAMHWAVLRMALGEDPVPVSVISQ